MLDLLGFLGGICFACAGVPTAVGCYTSGKNVSIPVFMCWLMISGLILTYTYFCCLYGFNLVFTINFSIEFLCWVTILRFHFFPRKL